MEAIKLSTFYGLHEVVFEFFDARGVDEFHAGFAVGKK